MDVTDFKELIQRELPALLRSDPSLREFLLELTRREHPSRIETEDRFYQLLGELRRDREEQNRKWQEQKEQQNRDREEQNRKWEEQKEQQNRGWEEQNRKWEEQNRKWDERSRRWDEQQLHNQQEFDRVHEEIMAVAQKHERSVGALGSRWGLQSEKAFRDVLAGILEKSFDVQVLNVNEYDDRGEVFGRPD